SGTIQPPVEIVGNALNNHITLTVSASNATVSGGDGNDVIDVIANTVLIHGNGGNDNLRAAGTSVSLFGDAGNDSLAGGTESDSFFGGAGIDVVDYSTRTSNLIVWLSGAHPSGQSGENDKFTGDIE